MEAAETTPETAAIMALAVLLEISIRALQVPQLVTEKLFSCTNFLKGMRPPQPGQHAIWFLDIGYWFCWGTIPVPKLGKPTAGSQEKSLNLTGDITENFRRQILQVVVLQL
jgi:hypothetical protein